MHPFFPDFTREHWAKLMPPIANGFMADVDTTLVEEIFYIAQRKRKSDIHHHGEADNLRRRLEIAEGIMFFIREGYEFSA